MTSMRVLRSVSGSSFDSGSVVSSTGSVLFLLRLVLRLVADPLMLRLAFLLQG